MGTEIIVISIAQLFILLYSLVVRGIHCAVSKVFRMDGTFGHIYKLNAVLIVVVSILIPVYWLYEISANYGFSVMYIMFLQVPLIVLTAFLLMGQVRGQA